MTSDANRRRAWPDFFLSHLILSSPRLVSSLKACRKNLDVLHIIWWHSPYEVFPLKNLKYYPSSARTWLFLHCARSWQNSAVSEHFITLRKSSKHRKIRTRPDQIWVGIRQKRLIQAFALAVRCRIFPFTSGTAPHVRSRSLNPPVLTFLPQHHLDIARVAFKTRPITSL